MSKSKGQLKDVSDNELEQMLTLQGIELPVSRDVGDHIASKKDIPKPNLEDIKTPEAARDWAERALIAETPRAAQEAIYQLRYGSSKERADMLKQILDRSGIQSANKVTNIAPVIVLTADAISNIPWAKKAVVDGTVSNQKQMQSGTVVDVEVVESK